MAMLQVDITKIDLNRQKHRYEGYGASITKMTAPDPVVSFALHGELLSGEGTAHLLEEERDALLTLITRIEERLMEDTQRRG